AFIDVDHAFDAGYARRLGVNLEGLLISQPDCAEQGLEIADQLVRSGAVAMVVVDSFPGLKSRAEIEGAAVDGHRARPIRQAPRKLAAVAPRMDAAVLFTNSIREK